MAGRINDADLVQMLDTALEHMSNEGPSCMQIGPEIAGTRDVTVFIPLPDGNQASQVAHTLDNYAAGMDDRVLRTSQINRYGLSEERRKYMLQYGLCAEADTHVVTIPVGFLRADGDRQDAVNGFRQRIVSLRNHIQRAL